MYNVFRDGDYNPLCSEVGSSPVRVKLLAKNLAKPGLAELSDLKSTSAYLQGRGHSCSQWIRNDRGAPGRHSG